MKPATTRAGRRGVTLIEVLIAAAVLAGALVALLTLLQGGLQGAAHLGTHARAESLSRSVLALYSRLSLRDLEEAWKAEGGDRFFVPVDADIRDYLGAPDEYRLSIGLRRLPGRIPVRALVSRVTWTGLTGERQVTHQQVLAFHQGTGNVVDPASGFRARRRNPDWGRRGRWNIVAYGDPDAGDESRSLEAMVSRAARRAAWRPDSYYAGESGETVHFQGDAEALRQRIRADPGRAARAPWVVRATRSSRERRRRQFEARTGLSGSGDLERPADAIPDGTYTYTLEALDLRDAAGYGRVVGVFTLTAEDRREYQLVASVSPRDQARTVGVDAVLHRELVEDAGGAVHVLQRTQGRLVRLTLDGEWIGRTLELRTLPAPDPGPAGTAMTRRFLAEHREERQLRPTRQLREDEILQALTQEFFGDDAQPAAPPVVEAIPQVDQPPPGCGSGPCPAGPRHIRAAAELHRKTTLRWRRRGDAPAGSDVAVQEALARVASGDPAAALLALDRHLEEHPDDLRTRMLRGRLRAAEGDPSGGADDLARVVRARPEDVDVRRDLAGFLLRAWRLDEAEEAIARFAAAAPDDPLVDTFQKSLALARETPEAARHLYGG